MHIEKHSIHNNKFEKTFKLHSNLQFIYIIAPSMKKVTETLSMRIYMTNTSLPHGGTTLRHHHNGVVKFRVTCSLYIYCRYNFAIYQHVNNL